MAKKNKGIAKSTQKKFEQQSYSQIESKGRKNHRAVLPFASRDFFPLVLIFFFMGVEWLTGLQSGDPKITQWIYLSVLSLITIIYVFLENRKTRAESISKILTSSTGLIYTLLIIWAALSMLWALNQVQSWMKYSTTIISFFSFIGIAAILLSRKHLVNYAAYFAMLILLTQVIYFFSQYFGQLGEINPDKIINEMKLNAGNKNIVAATLNIKLALITFIVFRSGIFLRILGLILGSLVLTCVIMLSSRAALLNIIFQSLAFAGLFIYTLTGVKRVKAWITHTGMVLVPVVIAYLLSSFIVNYAKEQSPSQNYVSTVTAEERLSTINLTTKGTMYRNVQWKNAINYFLDNPLKGSGWGNWLIQSIPAEREAYDDYYLSINVHNDYLEHFAEGGIIAGVLYIAYFLSLIYMVWKLGRKDRGLLLDGFNGFALIGIGSYMIDAFFAFPHVSPAMQIYCSFYSAFIVASYLEHFPLSVRWPSLKLSPYILGLSVILLPLTTWSQNNAYQLSISEMIFDKDFMTDIPKKNLADLEGMFPSFPNLNWAGCPVDAIYASYLNKAGQYDEALQKLSSARKANPYYPFLDKLTGQIYQNKNMPDSALKYAKKFFDENPRNRPAFTFYNETFFNAGDTSTLWPSFTRFSSYRQDVVAWYALIEFMMAHQPYTNQVEPYLDSALRLHPGADRLVFMKGVLCLDKNMLDSAAKYFYQATIAAPDYFATWENLGIVLFRQQKYDLALKQLEVAMQQENRVVNGNAEYYKALCLINLGKRQESCFWLKKSANFGHQDASIIIARYCP